jgi:hypothetical protein
MSTFIALVSRLVPAAVRREFRAEWDAELSNAWMTRPRGSWKGGVRVATRALGAVPDAWSLLRQQWSLDMMMQDLRYALRLLGRDRVLTIVATVTLALAIGANAAVFTVLEAVMLRPIPPAIRIGSWSRGRPRSEGAGRGGVFLS